MSGKFPQTCKHFNSPKDDIKSLLGYFHISGTFPMSLNCILKFLREVRGKFPCGNIPRVSTAEGGGNIHIENSLSFPLNFRTEIMRKFPQGWSLELPHNPHGNHGNNFLTFSFCHMFGDFISQDVRLWLCNLFNIQLHVEPLILRDTLCCPSICY